MSESKRARDWRSSFRWRWNQYGLEGEPVIDLDVTPVNVIARHGNRCSMAGCGGEFQELGHVVSVADGGAHTLENVVPLCRKHNRLAGTTATPAVALTGGEEGDGVALANDVRDRLLEVSSISRADAEALTLFALGTHHLDRAAFYPRALITSPAGGAGKTQVMKVLKSAGGGNSIHLVTDVTEAALRRIVSEYDSPRFILIDEAGKANETKTALINGGWERGAIHLGLEASPKGGHELVKRNIFGAVVVAGVGAQLRHDTLTRTIVVQLAPAGLVTSQRDPWREEATTNALSKRAAAWGRATTGKIPKANPSRIPENVAGRDLETWGALIHTGDLIGGEWGDIARRLAIEFAEGQDIEIPRSALAVAGVADYMAPEGIIVHPQAMASEARQYLIDQPNLEEFGRDYSHRQFPRDMKAWGIKLERRKQGTVLSAAGDDSGVLDGYERVVAAYPKMASGYGEGQQVPPRTCSQVLTHRRLPQALTPHTSQELPQLPPVSDIPVGSNEKRVAVTPDELPPNCHRTATSEGDNRFDSKAMDLSSDRDDSPAAVDGTVFDLTTGEWSGWVDGQSVDEGTTNSDGTFTSAVTGMKSDWINDDSPADDSHVDINLNTGRYEIWTNGIVTDRGTSTGDGRFISAITGRLMEWVRDGFSGRLQPVHKSGEEVTREPSEVMDFCQFCGGELAPDDWHPECELEHIMQH